MAFQTDIIHEHERVNSALVYCTQLVCYKMLNVFIGAGKEKRILKRGSQP